jgi:hypothetical protein
VEVQFQIPVLADPGTVFHPINPARAFDSRNPAFVGSGLLAPNGNKVISIKDGFDLNGVLSQANIVPANATAITYNLTVTGGSGGNFVSVTPGNAAAFTTSAINFSNGDAIANAATVLIAPDRTIKVWAGPGSSTHVLIDITGYYAPYVPPNMAG